MSRSTAPATGGRPAAGRRCRPHPGSDDRRRFAARTSCRTAIPSRWQWNGSSSWLPEIARHEPRNQDRLPRLPATSAGRRTRAIRISRSIATAALRARAATSTGPDSVQVFDYPTYTSSGVRHQSAYVNDKINLTLEADRQCRRAFRPLLVVAARAGQPGDGPVRRPRICFPSADDFPVYRNWSPRTSIAYDVFGNGTRGAQGQLRQVHRRRLGPAGRARADRPRTSIPRRSSTKTYNNWDGSIPYVPIPANLASTSGGGGTPEAGLEL